MALIRLKVKKSDYSIQHRLPPENVTEAFRRCQTVKYSDSPGIAGKRGNIGNLNPFTAARIDLRC